MAVSCETPMQKKDSPGLAFKVLCRHFKDVLIREKLCDRALLVALQNQELLTQNQVETVEAIHQTDNKVYELTKILSSTCRDRTVLERFYCALHDAFESKSNTCHITGSYRWIFESFRHIGTYGHHDRGSVICIRIYSI